MTAAREAIRREIAGTPWCRTDYEQAVAAELTLARRASAILAVTRAEAALFSAQLEVPVYVAAHTVCAHPSSAAFETRQDLLFVGRLTGGPSVSPNVDSIVWFVREVMPILDRKIGAGYKLRLVGLLDSEEVSALLSDRVVALGVVERLDGVFDEARVFIAPTRFAAGLPLKIVESMTRGLPCATSPLLKVQLGQAELADDLSAERFATDVARLYLDEGTGERRAQRGCEASRNSSRQRRFATRSRRRCGS